MLDDNMPQAPSDYQAFLVRMWRDGSTSPWHASVQRPSSAEVMRFSSLEQLFVYLHRQVREE